MHNETDYTHELDKFIVNLDLEGTWTQYLEITFTAQPPSLSRLFSSSASDLFVSLSVPATQLMSVPESEFGG